MSYSINVQNINKNYLVFCYAKKWQGMTFESSETCNSFKSVRFCMLVEQNFFYIQDFPDLFENLKIWFLIFKIKGSMELRPPFVVSGERDGTI